MAGPQENRYSQVLAPGMWVVQGATSGLLAQTSRDYSSYAQPEGLALFHPPHTGLTTCRHPELLPTSGLWPALLEGPEELHAVG